MSDIKYKIKKISDRVGEAANGQISTSYWGDADNNLSAPRGVSYWQWIEQAENEALTEADAMQARIVELEKTILEVLDDHGDLADGDVCTLIKLKRVMGL